MVTLVVVVEVSHRLIKLQGWEVFYKYHNATYESYCWNTQCITCLCTEICSLCWVLMDIIIKVNCVY